jgi:hypothetical protein
MLSFKVNRTTHRDDRRYAASCANGQRPASCRSVNGDALCLRDIANLTDPRRGARFIPAIRIRSEKVATVDENVGLVGA